MSKRLHIQDLAPDLSVVDTLRRFEGVPFLTLLDSAADIRERDARYSFLTADPVDTVRLNEAQYRSDPFKKLREWQSVLPRIEENAPPFCGGIAGLMSYELGHAFEDLPSPEKDEFETPALVAGLFDWAIVWDHIEPSVRLCVLNMKELQNSSGDSAMWARVNWVQGCLSGALPKHTDSDNVPSVLPSSVRCGHRLQTEPNVYSCFSREDYTTAVERVIEYIRAGDIFQANLSQQMIAPWSGTAIDLYQQVRNQNPAPFCGLLQFEDSAVVSASPERFLKVVGSEVETRPIKGTRRRHRSPIADLFTGNELYASEKDRAENVMIVDLMRNDLSRVCQPGTVKVTGLCEIEVFETVQHLVSTIKGHLQTDHDVWDLCKATVPGGSITGAPKIRAMQIIAELEPSKRGAYCGNLFYLGPGQHFDSSILIRTFTLKHGFVQFPVGGGIVADSLPKDEYDETLHKAAGMLRALRQELPTKIES